MNWGESTARTVALVAAVGILIGALGPWETFFLGEVSGTQGDGRITLVLSIVAGLIVLTQRPRSRWLLLAVVLGVICAVTGTVDLIRVSSSTQHLFDREVDIVDPGWGLWLTSVASIAFTLATFLRWKEEAPSPTPAPESDGVPPGEGPPTPEA